MLGWQCCARSNDGREPIETNAAPYSNWRNARIADKTHQDHNRARPFHIDRSAAIRFLRTCRLYGVQHFRCSNDEVADEPDIKGKF